jgi:cytochrome c
MNQIALIIAGLAVSSFSTAALADAALAKKAGCMNCHALAATVVGPAFKDIAAKYKGKADAPAAMTAKILNGGSGAWGTMPMPAQKGKLSEADAKTLANWSLAQ